MAESVHYEMFIPSEGLWVTATSQEDYMAMRDQIAAISRNLV